MFQLSLVGVLFGNCMTDSLLSRLGGLRTPSILRLFPHVY